jgi:hypothetical protein
MSSEVWKDIPGYEGKYQASNCGRVKNLERIIIRPHPKSKIPTKYKIHGRLLKTVVNFHGYLVVGLGSHNTQKVHRLIVLTFLGGCPSGMEVRHLNGRKTDNRIENLSYGTRTENHIDRYGHGGRMGTLSVTNVVEIRRLIDRGELKTATIATFYGVTPGAINHIR